MTDNMFLWLLDCSCGCAMCIKLTKEEIRQSGEYEDFEAFIMECLEDKYNFRLSNCSWMVSDSYEFERIGY